MASLKNMTCLLHLPPLFLTPTPLKRLRLYFQTKEELFKKHKNTKQNIFQANIVTGSWSSNNQQPSHIHYTR